MSTPLVTTLRAQTTIRIAPEGSATITIRAQVAEAWDAVRIEAAPGDTIAAVKAHALEALEPTADFPDEYRVSLGGITILDEQETLAEAGVRGGATLLIQHRHRRPVR